MRILIIEDEARLAETLAALLSRQGYTSDVCGDGESGLDSAASGIYDLIVLDVMLPKRDGLSLLRALRETGSTVPVLLLTARSEIADRVAGLDAGADYYLTKPFEPSELFACIRALTRRGSDLRSADLLTFGDIRLDRLACTLSCREKTSRLSRKEYDIMELLMANGTNVVTKEQIIVKVWGFSSDAEDNNVEVYISFLRRKLAFLGSTVRIRTLRMLGYTLEEEPYD